MRKRKRSQHTENGINGEHQSSRLDLDCLTESHDLCPITYVYDYLPDKTKWLQPQSVSLPNIRAEVEQQRSPILTEHQDRKRNSILLDGRAARFPLHTGLVDFRQNKFWRATEEATIELLELVAQDSRCGRLILRDKRSMSDLAREQLRVGVRDSYNRFTVHMLADADETRIRLLAQSMMLIFIFDDVWENSSSTTIESLRDSFVSIIQGSGFPKSPLEHKMAEMREGFLACDAKKGNGGTEVLQTLIDFCYHSKPTPGDFRGVRDYLNYRWEDIANNFAWACAKFAVESSADSSDLKFCGILRLLGDHISLANDLASYEKEKRHYETGRMAAIVNVVNVLMTRDRLDAKAAKVMAFAWQLYVENEIIEEVKRLGSDGGLSSDEWTFIEACFTAVSGSFMSAVVMWRYGGESAKVSESADEGSPETLARSAKKGLKAKSKT
ncbi:hypothetical protein ACLMJK_005619 [Lecanora helva]